MRLILAQIVLASPIYRSFTASSMAAIISLWDKVLEVTEKLRPFARRLVSIWVICLEDILITHFFLSVMLVALPVTLFFLISSSNFCNVSFLLNQKISDKNFHESFLHSKILPFHCKNVLLCSILILLFSCRSFGRILLWWQQRKS